MLQFSRHCFTSVDSRSDSHVFFSEIDYNLCRVRGSLDSCTRILYQHPLRFPEEKEQKTNLIIQSFQYNQNIKPQYVRSDLFCIILDIEFRNFFKDSKFFF